MYKWETTFKVNPGEGMEFRRLLSLPNTEIKRVNILDTGY